MFTCGDGCHLLNTKCAGTLCSQQSSKAAIIPILIVQVGWLQHSMFKLLVHSQLVQSWDSNPGQPGLRGCLLSTEQHCLLETLAWWRCLFGQMCKSGAVRDQGGMGAMLLIPCCTSQSPGEHSWNRGAWPDPQKLWCSRSWMEVELPRWLW